MSENITIKEHEIPIRLDRYIRTLDPFMTQGVVEKSLRSGSIKVNGQKVKSNHRISNGDIVSFSQAIEKRQQADVKSSGIVVALAKKLLGEYLLHEESEFLAVNKPSGLASQGGTKISLSLDDALGYLNTKNFDLRLVHRLDRDTSGVMLLAKTRDAAVRLTEAFRDNKIHKTYYACISPVPKEKQGRIESYLLKTSEFEVKSYPEVVKGSKFSITDYEIINSNGNMALVKFLPITGRMHQIRVHSKQIGCPIVGDARYGGVPNNNLMLHAAEVRIDKSVLGEEVIVQALLPAYFPLQCHPGRSKT